MKIWIFLLIASTVLGCATKKEKPFTVAVQKSARKTDEVKLPNGLILTFIDDPSLPRVGFSLLVKVGAAQDPQGKEGLGSMVATLIDEGSSDKSAPEVAEGFAQLGTVFSASIGSDATILSTSGLANSREKLLELFADVIFHPAFSQKELDRKRADVLAQLKKIQDNSSTLADVLLIRQVYQGTDYGNLFSGSSKAVSAFGRADLLRHYFAYYRPNNSNLAVYGQMDEGFKKKVKEVFSTWASETIPKPNIDRGQTPINQPKFLFYEKPDSQQAQIRMGFRSIARSNPDYLKVRVANVILGGAFASRLNQKVRDDLGLTYSIASELDARRERGHFLISTFTRHEKLAETIKATQQTFQEFVEKGVTDEELEAAKALLIGQFPAALETVDLWAYNFLMLRLYGVSDSYLYEFKRNISQVSVKDINEVLQKYFKGKAFDVVIVADPRKSKDALSQFPGLERRKVPLF